MNKKLVVITILCAIYAMPSIFGNSYENVLSNAQSSYNEQLKKVGRDRVFAIMYDGDHGIKSHNNLTTYAQTINISEDLELPAIALYFPTRTDIGQTFLIDTLSTPLSPNDKHNTLQIRQNVLKKIIKTPEIKDKLDLWMAQAKVAETKIMEMMINRERAVEQLKMPDLSDWGIFEPVVKPWYVLDHYIANHPWTNLAGNATAAYIATLFGAISAQQGLQAINEIKEFKNNPDTQIFSENMHQLYEYGKNQDVYQHDLKHNPTKIWNIYANASAGGLYGALSPELQKTTLSTLGALGAGTTAYHTAKSVYNDYKLGLNRRDLIHALHQFITIAENIEKLCKEHGITMQFKPSDVTNPNGKYIIDGIKHPRYSETESKFVATPWVNTFINEIYQQDVYLAPIFATIAEMDTYHAIATKIVQQQTQPNTFCFTKFLSDATPSIQADGFWNIIIKNPVPNSLSETRSIIFTGANAGGKSTAMRSLLQNIILSQTFGIATGTAFAYTPYHVIHSYLHIVDDPINGLSRYRAELKCASEIIQQAKTLAPGDKYFFIIDELFTGTGGKEGEVLAYEFITEDLAPYLGSTQFVFATHFDQLKEIEIKNPKYFANYKINPPVLGADNKLKYPFTMTKGANNVNIAGLLKKEMGLLGKNNPPAHPDIFNSRIDYWTAPVL